MKGSKNRADRQICRAILFINPQKKQARDLADEIMKELVLLNIEADTVYIGEGDSFSSEKHYDLAISLGGDGTVLSAARAMSPGKVPIFPVNFGTFGFIAGVNPLEWREVFAQWLKGKALLSRRLMLEVILKQKDNEMNLGCCLNEVVISNPGKIINFKVSLREDDQIEPFKQVQYRSDGLVVATPTGSTAYSVAAGGPIVDHELEAIILTPICPFTLTHRPTVLLPKEIITIEPGEKEREGISVRIDGQLRKKMKVGDILYIKKAPNPCLLVASGRREFFQALGTKLAW